METKAEGKSQRKTLLVNRPLQFRLMAYMTGIAAMSSLMTSMSSYVLSTFAVENGVATTTSIIFGFSLVLVVIWISIVLLFSNRVFGPVYRLQRELRNWREGKPVQQITLRRGDHLSDVIDDFNAVVAKMNQQ